MVVGTKPSPCVRYAYILKWMQWSIPTGRKYKKWTSFYFLKQEINLQAQGKRWMECIAFVLALKEVCVVLEKTVHHLTECYCCQMYPDLLQQIVTPSSPWDGLCLRHRALSLTLAFSCSRTWLDWGKNVIQSSRWDKAQRNLVTVMAGQRFENNFSGLELKTETETNMMKWKTSKI